ncbi:hypothetical protein [Bradyrhizobium brasilense]|uniref:hypothetical protein n=1 Tax=Bradyrhizobium brasilense TaxID=1419277 RepID=UPI001E435C01|nr:hypothetical protein [Bradyrhizobium brasilense]
MTDPGDAAQRADQGLRKAVAADRQQRRRDVADDRSLEGVICLHGVLPVFRED